MLCLFLRAVGINLFFRKSFEIKSHLVQVLGFLAASFAPPQYTYTICVSLLGIFVLSNFLGAPQYFGVSSLDRQDGYNFIATFLFVNVIENLVQSCHPCCTEQLATYWFFVPLLSLFQISRNPLALKNFFRPFRVALGPTSILMAVSLGIMEFASYFSQCNPMTGCFHIFKFAKMLLGVLGAGSSFLAGFVFRPDNFEILNSILETPPAQPTIRKWHAFLNYFSVLFCALIIICLNVLQESLQPLLM